MIMEKDYKPLETNNTVEDLNPLHALLCAYVAFSQDFLDILGQNVFSVMNEMNVNIVTIMNSIWSACLSDTTSFNSVTKCLFIIRQ